MGRLLFIIVYITFYNLECNSAPHWIYPLETEWTGYRFLEDTVSLILYGLTICNSREVNLGRALVYL